MKSIKTNAYIVIPARGTNLITEVPAKQLTVQGLNFAVAKILGRWGVFEPESGAHVCRGMKTRKEAIQYSEKRIAENIEIVRENMGPSIKSRAAVEIGNFVKFSELDQRGTK